LKIKLPFKMKKAVLAAGGDIKNRICFARGNAAFLEPIINDLGIWNNLRKFQNLLERRLKKGAKVLVFDQHPAYFSSRFTQDLSREKKVKSVAIWHHHAHIASCMAEHGLVNKKVIAVAFDGTGFGRDGNLWGGEFLIADYRNFSRIARFDYIPLIGGEKAIYEVWRLSAAWLYKTLGQNFLKLKFFKLAHRKEWPVLLKMWQEKFNSPLASSVGRLFDAAAALILNLPKVKYEAQAAIALERKASKYKLPCRPYSFEISKKKGEFIIMPQPVFRQIVSDLKKGVKKEEIAARFHLGIAELIRQMCRRIKKKSSINTVVLSGGVFQNRLLFKLSQKLLKEEGFTILTHKRLPCSDASLALGQAVIANYAA